MDKDDQYYLQDSRSYTGNDMMFWKASGVGYTSDLSKADVFPKSVAIELHNIRETDIPWPKSYIDEKTRPAVDVQYVNRDLALKGTGIVIRVVKPKRVSQRCTGCGKFVASYRGYCTTCDNY